MKRTTILFGIRIKELRKNLKLSQEELAERANISAKYLSRIEMGQQFPSIDMLERLAGTLKVELKDFFEFSHGTNNRGELIKNIKNLLEEADDERLKLLVKLVRAVIR